jgi:hypothetical protein
MTSLQDFAEVVIGVDIHVHSHSAAAVDARTGGVLAELTVPATPGGYQSLVDFAGEHAGREAPVLLLQAAERLEPLHVGLARETYLYAWVASSLAGPLAGPGGLLLEVSRAARAVPPPAGAPRPCDLLLDGLATMVTQGHAAAEPTLRRAVDTFLGDQVSGEEWLQWGILAQMAAMAVWDFDSWVVLSTRHVELARASGALAPLSIALNGHGQVATHCGDFETATSLAAACPGPPALRRVAPPRAPAARRAPPAARRGTVHQRPHR